MEVTMTVFNKTDRRLRRLIEGIVPEKNSYFTAGELKMALDCVDDDTDVYISQGKDNGNLCRKMVLEPDGTITLTCEKGMTNLEAALKIAEQFSNNIPYEPYYDKKYAKPDFKKSALNCTDGTHNMDEIEYRKHLIEQFKKVSKG